MSPEPLSRVRNALLLSTCLAIAVYKALALPTGLGAALSLLVELSFLGAVWWLSDLAARRAPRGATAGFGLIAAIALGLIASHIG